MKRLINLNTLKNFFTVKNYKEIKKSNHKLWQTTLRKTVKGLISATYKELGLVENRTGINGIMGRRYEWAFHRGKKNGDTQKNKKSRSLISGKCQLKPQGDPFSPPMSRVWQSPCPLPVRVKAGWRLGQPVLPCPGAGRSHRHAHQQSRCPHTRAGMEQCQRLNDEPSFSVRLDFSNNTEI